jgi:flagellar biosynthesis chaperone FliJ
MQQPLTTLLEIAERERDAAATALVQAQDTVRRLVLQMEQLSQYRGVLQAAELRVQQSHQALIAHETRVAGVAKLLQRRQREHDALQERQDQRRNDELALQRHWRQRMDSRLAAL